MNHNKILRLNFLIAVFVFFSVVVIAGDVIVEIGNVGIGTTDPKKKLHVVGNARITGLTNCNTIDTDASGNLVCGTTLWTLSGSDIYRFGEVGINKQFPSDPLHIRADSGGDNIRLEEYSGSEDWQIGVDSAGDLNFEDMGTNRVTFEDGGEVGIGTLNPDSELHVKGSFAHANADIELETNNGLKKWTVSAEQATGRFAIYDKTNNKNPFYIEGNTPSNTLFIESTGDVGIGTTDPKTKLDITGAIKIGDTTAGCTTTIAGAIRYNGALEYCDGSEWQAVTPGGGAPPQEQVEPVASQIWSKCSTESYSTGKPWYYTVGYKFSPTKDGQISKLCGYFDGTKTVKLYDSGYDLLDSASVTSSNSWSCTDITSVSVTSGLDYYVVGYIAGSGGVQQSLSQILPRTCGDVIVKMAVYQSGNNFDANHKWNTANAYGVVDVVFG